MIAHLTYAPQGRLETLRLYVCDSPHLSPVRAVWEGRWVDGHRRHGCRVCFPLWQQIRPMTQVRTLPLCELFEFDQPLVSVIDENAPENAVVPLDGHS